MKILKVLLVLLLLPSLALADTQSQFARMLGSYTIFPGAVAGQRGSIQANTEDGTDSASVCVSGGGGSLTATCANTRGGALLLYGNEEGAAPGGFQLRGGNVANSLSYIDLTSSTGSLEVRDSSSVDLIKILSAGAITVPQAASAANKGVVLGLTAMPSDVGTSTALYAFGNASSAANLVLGSGVNSSSAAVATFAKSRATDGSADVIVQSGDQISQINFFGANGTTFSPAARIIATVDGTPGASADMPGAIDFQVSPDGAATTATALKITNDKLITVQNSINFNTSATGIFGPGGAADILYVGQAGADGSDDARVIVAGGATGAPGRGSSATFYGNDYGSPNAGGVIIGTGDAANALLRFTLNHSGATVQVRDSSDVTKLTINATGQITSQGTSDIGWTVQAAANQACNTTCTSACVFGQETTSKAILACTDATADSCLCAGAS